MNQEPGNMAVLVGSKRDEKRKRQFRGEKLQEAFRPEAQFREFPVGWQLYCQERTLACDEERLGPGGYTAQRSCQDR
jgi:hypothetical protein